MKKTRIISVLLAALMAGSALPTTAFAAVGDEIVTSGSGGAAADAGWAGVGTAALTAKGEDNQYIHVYDRTNNGSGFLFKTYATVNADTQYVVKFKIRSQNSEGEMNSFRVYFRKTDNKTAVCSEQWVKNVGSEWTDVALTFTPTATASDFGVEVGGSSTYYHVLPYDIDDFGLYLADDTTFSNNLIGRSGANNDVAELNGGTVTTSNVASLGITKISGCKVKLVTESPYTKVSGMTKKTDGITFSEDVTLTPGIYKVSGDFRLSDFDNTSIKSYVDDGVTVTNLGIKHNKTDCTYTHTNGTVYDDECTDTSDKIHHTYYEPGTNTSMGSAPKQSGDYYYHTLWWRNSTSSWFIYNGNFRSMGVSVNGEQLVWDTYDEAKGIMDTEGKYIKVDTEWTHGEATFVVKEAAALSSLSFHGGFDARDVEDFDFDNISLVCLGEFEETLDYGEDNLLDGIKASYPGVVTNYEVEENGYVYIRERVEADDLLDGKNNDTPDNFLNIAFGVNSVEGTTYYVSFDFRADKPAEEENSGAASSAFRFRPTTGVASVEKSENGFTADYWVSADGCEIEQKIASTGAYPYMSAVGGEDAKYVGTFTAAESGKPIVFKMGRGPGWYPHALTIDNICFYTMEGGVKNVLWEADLDTEDDIARLGFSSDCPNEWIYVEDYSHMTVLDDETAGITYDVAGLGFTDGIYKFAMSVKTAEEGSAGRAKLVYTVAISETESETRESEWFDVADDFTDISLETLVIDGSEITGLALVTDITGDIEYKKVMLNFKPFEVITEEDDTDYLDGTTVKVEGADFESVVIDEPNGYLLYPERQNVLTDNKPDNFITVKVADLKPCAGVTYHVEFDIKGNGFVYRPYVNFRGTEAADMNGNYLVPGPANTLVNEGGPKYPRMSVVGTDWMHYDGIATPSADQSTFEFRMGRTDSFKGQEFAIDNISIWYMNGDEKVVAYEESFDGEVLDTAPMIFYSDAPNRHVLDVTHLKVTPNGTADETTVRYALNIPEEEAVEGQYIFKATLKTDDRNAAPVDMELTYTFEDGTVKSTTWTVGSTWETKVFYRPVSDAALVSVTLTWEGDTALQIRDAKLMIDEPDVYAIPNLGLLMMLVKKQQGYFPAGDKKYQTPEVEGNLLTNGNFNSEVTVVAGDKYDASVANAWFQNDGPGYEMDSKGAAIKDKPIQINQKVEWNKQGYITVSGRTNNLRYVYYNSGIMLEPGDYTFTIDLKAANENETSMLRFAIIDLWSPTINDQVKITEEWTTATVNFTVTEKAPFNLRFFGGAGASYKHDYCVDNMVLIKK